MKKKYIAPSIAIEHYELTQAIASCVTKIGFQSSDCVINDSDASPNMKDFAYDGGFMAGKCDEPVTSENSEDGICYHTSANTAFTS